MKITKRTLQKLIKEELRRVLRENEDEGFSMLDRGQPSPAIFSQGELDFDEEEERPLPSALRGLNYPKQDNPREGGVIGSKSREFIKGITTLWYYLHGSSEDAPSAQEAKAAANALKGLYLHGVINGKEQVGISKISKVGYSKKSHMATLQLQSIRIKNVKFADHNIEITREGELFYNYSGSGNRDPEFSESFQVIPLLVVEPNKSEEAFKVVKEPKSKESGAKQSEFDL